MGQLIFYGTGRAEWIDKGHKKCLILWHRIQDWADLIVQFVSDPPKHFHISNEYLFGFLLIYLFFIFDQVRENGLADNVMTVEEIRSGTESRGTGTYWLFQISRMLKYCQNRWSLEP